jgi:hypothetical protein
MEPCEMQCGRPAIEYVGEKHLCAQCAKTYHELLKIVLDKEAENATESE